MAQRPTRRRQRDAEVAGRAQSPLFSQRSSIADARLGNPLEEHLRAQIPAAEANELLGKPGDEEFKYLVHGDSDFETNWKGPIENYECKDGVIRCKPGKGALTIRKN